eukprot:m.91519 g.91519  ORF g.91519 m.91519 type:complete len:261 (-) comp12950_c0_seq1:178-960(-)
MHVFTNQLCRSSTIFMTCCSVSIPIFILYLATFVSSLSGVPLTDDKLATLTRAVEVSRVQKVKIKSSDVSPKACLKLGEALKYGATLQELHMSLNAIGDGGAINLAKGLENNKSLLWLSLGQCSIGPEGAASLALVLSTTCIADLYLHQNMIGAVGARAVSEALKQQTTIKRLGLAGNQFGDEGAQYLAQGLAKNTTLEWLSIEQCRIGDLGAQAISKALCSNSALKALHMGGNLLSGKAMTALQTAVGSRKDLSLTFKT